MDAFAALEGEWSLSRTLDPGIGTMTGTARFTQVDDDVLHYREEGRVELATGHRGDAWREYDYRRCGDEIRVCFVGSGRDGQVLHVLRPTPDGDAADVHHCGPDTYVGRYHLASDRLVVDMTVTGPRKDYSTHTVYERPSPTAASSGG